MERLALEAYRWDRTVSQMASHPLEILATAARVVGMGGSFFILLQAALEFFVGLERKGTVRLGLERGASVRRIGIEWTFCMIPPNPLSSL